MGDADREDRGQRPQAALMDSREPDISALAERLGMRGMRYRSFGNPPYRGPRRAAPAAQAPESPLPEPQRAAPPSWPAHAAVPAPPPSTRPTPPTPPVPAFPLIAQALAAASGPASPAAPDDRAAALPGALPFLALRAAVRGAGD
jgi:hypothetical protein